MSTLDSWIVVLALVVSVVRWLVTRWALDGTTLRIETGLLRRSSLRYPLSQVQAIDTVRPGIARALGRKDWAGFRSGLPAPQLLERAQGDRDRGP